MPVIALDVGERRIGVAVSDPAESYALPLRTLERSSLRDDVRTIAALAKEHGAATIVVGDPLRLSGERGIASERMDRFCAALARVYDGTIARADERLTTAQAQRTLIGADLSRTKRKRVVDQVAAALILDGYLARRRVGP